VNPTGLFWSDPSGRNVAKRPSRWLFRYFTWAFENVATLPPIVSLRLAYA
jgi:hypothetical protein